MSVKSQPLIPENQTFSFIEASTDRGNLTYGNYSSDGQELNRNDDPFLKLWTDFNKYKYIFWGIMLCIVVIGTIGNILVFIMMGGKKLSYLSYSVYLKCLAVSDSCLLITTLIYETEKIYFLWHIAELEIIVCMLPFFFRILSTWSVVGLTVDRYVCVCFPLKRDTICTRKKAIVFCSGLLGLSLVLILPFSFSIEVVRGQCFPSEDIKYYYMFIRLLVASFLPCFVILVLNICIVIQIQRSHKFRNMFLKATTNSANRQQDNASRPLVLVSVLAFVTMLPGAIEDTVILAMRIWHRDSKYLPLIGDIWLICFIIYLLNFGQNFYILIGSSANYRQIIRKRLRCCTLKRNKTNQPNQAMATNSSCNMTGLESTTTGLSLESNRN